MEEGAYFHYMGDRARRILLNKYLLSSLGILALFALALFLMGRVPICKCGYVLLWYGNPVGSGNSQHLSDWYSFSHIIHGFLFYFFLWLVLRRLPLGARFLGALLVETGWELLENTDWVINYYRTETISLDYYGDSIINSVADVLFMALGFFLARRLPVGATVALAVFFELFTLYFIRDNLTLNVLMLLYPLEAVKRWQIGG